MRAPTAPPDARDPRDARDARYDGVARTAHWLIAALILLLVALGAWLTAAGYYDRWYQDALF